jgi:hypothetical protein
VVVQIEERVSCLLVASLFMVRQIGSVETGSEASVQRTWDTGSRQFDWYIFGTSIHDSSLLCLLVPTVQSTKRSRWLAIHH